MSFKKNTVARDYCVKFLYQCEAEKIFFFSVNHFTEFSSHFKMSAEVKEVALELVNGVFINIQKIDEYIGEAAAKWSLDRLTTTDRAILRLAIYELLETNTPVKVILNEAIKNAKQYGTDNSGSFVNGVLDYLAKKIRG